MIKFYDLKATGSLRVSIGPVSKFLKNSFPLRSLINDRRFSCRIALSHVIKKIRNVKKGIFSRKLYASLIFDKLYT